MCPLTHPANSALADDLLKRIERTETTSLVWGFVDGSLTRQEACELATYVIRERGSSEDPEDVVEDLIDAHLLYEFQGPDGLLRLRSRFAEGVRLLSRLRQLFPRQPWSAAPRLVSDFRVDVRSRRFPHRNIDPSSALEQIKADVSLTDFEGALWNSLLHPGGTSLCLAKFQVESARYILKNTNDYAAIITAGTGSGKTLCFYVPALMRIGTKVQEGMYWTKALAIYPRTELLKDQFAEAFRLARRLDKVLLDSGRRPIIISALFGSTPDTCGHEALEKVKWQRRGATGYICPFIICPECGAEMIWRTQDLESMKERLVCSRLGQCKGTIEENTIILTRSRSLRSQPDILFTTTEMLNRRMSDTNMRRLFGLGMPNGKRPFLALLDEVHTYTGTSGAHAALVLRRWRHAVRTSMTVVGLSATLLGADSFLSTLSGLPQERVQEISPKQEDMILESAEYQIVLRGDPVSQTSLLSTTIQASMLLGRLMDPPERGSSGGRFGNRVFVFSDDLDVINRLYDDLRDAEGYDIFGNRRPGRQPLASLRQQDSRHGIQFDLDGQRWKVCEDIGRDLDRPLRVSRTTSQDTGVVSGSDIVVATAALEVGYDDPGVGAVVQHKAPRNMAAYVQRKGRAGRSRSMRPFTVTVLSDYGRDRIAYQTYDQLFDPLLPPQQLPVRNQYILRMQAVFALIDWLAARKGNTVPNGWFWHSLSAPAGPGQPGVQKRQDYTRELLGKILKGEDQPLLKELSTHLAEALAISDEEVNSLLWEAPRSLMLEVIPTLVSRLYRKWRLCMQQPGQSQHEFFMPNLPLPEFIPASLFNELSLPEVKIIVPPATSRHEEKVEALPLIQAMNQLIPGRVNRRFAPERGGLCHWIPVAFDNPELNLLISDYAEESEYVGQFPAVLNGSESMIPVYRPWSIRLRAVNSREISPSSNAFLNWSTDFCIHGEAIMIEPPVRTAWSEVVQSIECYLHSFRSAISVRRFALSATASIRHHGIDSNILVRFVDENNSRAAIGFEQEVDGFVIKYRLPPLTGLNDADMSPGLRASCRSAFFRNLVLTDTEFPGEANSFQRDWLQQIYLSALLATACRSKVSLWSACELLKSKDALPEFMEVMHSIFSIQEVRQAIVAEEGGNGEEDDEETHNSRDPQRRARPDSGAGHDRMGRLQQRLTDLLSQSDVVTRLHSLASCLWSPDREAWRMWLRGKIHETFGQAVLSACLQCAPQHAGFDTLLVDPDRLHRDSPDSASIYITENTLGGGGVIQALTERFSEEPRILFSAVEAALSPGDFELAAIELKRFMTQVCNDDDIAELTSKVSVTFGHDQREVYRKALYRKLSEKGIHIGHVASVALNARLLRSGMDGEAYRLLLDLFDYWDQLEGNFEVAVDHRVFCYLAAIHEDFSPRLRRMLRVGDDTDVTDIVSAISGIIWPKASEIRQRTLESYNPFRRLQTTDPLLIHELLLIDKVASVSIDDSDWMDRLAEGLGACGTCRLTASVERESELRQATVKVIAMPVDVEFLQLFPAVERFEQTEHSVSVVFTLREAV